TGGTRRAVRKTARLPGRNSTATHFDLVRYRSSVKYGIPEFASGVPSGETTAERNEADCFPKSVATASSNDFSQSVGRGRHFRCRRFHAERRRCMVDGLTRRRADLRCTDADRRFLTIFFTGPPSGLGWE